MEYKLHYEEDSEARSLPTILWESVSTTGNHWSGEARGIEEQVERLTIAVGRLLEVIQKTDKFSPGVLGYIAGVWPGIVSVENKGE